MRKTHTITNADTGAVAKVYRDAENNEYVVKLVGHPDADYFTNDKDDAISTAHAMVQDRSGHHQSVKEADDFAAGRR